MQIKRLSAIAFGHFSIDILNSSIALILTVLSGKFELSISQIGLAAMIYTFAASLTQPFFGILADYVRGRWLAALSVAWTAFFFGLAAFMPNYGLLVACFTVGALGSGAFHPVGILNAATAGGPYPTTATSLFFLVGQSGLALGPITAGLIFQTMPIKVGMPLMALGALPAILMMGFYLRQPLMTTPAKATPPTVRPHATTNPARHALVVGTAFILVITLRVTTSQSLVTLLPKYLADLGYQPALYGSMVGVFSFGGAIGTFIGGYLGDRYSRRALLVISTLLSIPFSYGLLHTTGWLFWPLAALAGGLLNAPHSILVVMAQEFLPKRQGMMGGAALGFTFASGALMAWVASWAADWVGLAPVLTLLAFVPIGAAVSALALPAAQPRTLAESPATASAAAD